MKPHNINALAASARILHVSLPMTHSTGGKQRLLGISTRGDRYLRKLLVHVARATLRWTKLKHDRRSQWVRALIARRGTNRAVVALANKNARIAWVLLTTDQVYAPVDTVA
jgi:transposase